MSAHTSVWTRIGSFLRNATGSSYTNGDGDYVAHNGGSTHAPRRNGGIMRMMRSPARDAYERVGELMTSIERHFEAQDRRAEQLSDSVGRVANILEKLGESQSAQEGCVRAIANQVEASGRLAASISDALGKMPASFQAQGDALRTIARQLEVLQESDGQLVISLQKFGSAADALRASGVAQVEMLRELHATDSQRHGEATALIRDQGRRFMIVVIAAAAAVVAAIGGAVGVAMMMLR